MRQTTAVIFDMDGLIFDTERLKLRAWERAGADMGYSDFGKNLYPNLGRNNDRQYFAETYGDAFPYDEFEARCMRYIKAELDEKGPQPKPGLFPLLEYLKEQDYQTAIATSSTRQTAQKYLHTTGITSYFSEIISGDMVTHSKPHPESYLTACRVLQVSPEHALVLEDSRNGIRSALAAKIPVIMIPDLLKSFPEEEPYLAAKLPTLEDVIPWLEARKMPAR